MDGAGCDEVKLRSALSLVDEAIFLDSNNNTALLLKDRIQIAIGGQTLICVVIRRRSEVSKGNRHTPRQ